jgi:hypothetical protein
MKRPEPKPHQWVPGPGPKCCVAHCARCGLLRKKNMTPDRKEPYRYQGRDGAWRYEAGGCER